MVNFGYHEDFFIRTTLADQLEGLAIRDLIYTYASTRWVLSWGMPSAGVIIIPSYRFMTTAARGNVTNSALP